MPDDYVLRHDGRSLDLDAEVREQAILALPMRQSLPARLRRACARAAARISNEGPCSCAAGGPPRSGADPAPN